MYIDTIQFSVKMYSDMFKRSIESVIEKYLKDSTFKIFFIWGPRRSGKTTILKKIASELKVPIFNFDVISDRQKFTPEREVLQKLVDEHKVILIDEVQNYPESTLALKILYDEFKVKIIATGSSELRQKSADFDSLSGRFIEGYCLPLSIYEIVDNTKIKSYEKKEFENKLQKRIQIFGSYPEVYTQSGLSESDRIDLLSNILDTYVLKDVVNIYELKNEKLAKDILTKIALQLGSEVSIREIANSLQANVSTVANYIEIFIKNYILIPLPSFKTNIRKAVSENRKVYFYDLGIRNILIKDFRDLELRQDRGGVFENFIISELEKLRRISSIKVNMYFYREYGGKEVDIVLEDYKKNYHSLEVKIDKGQIRDIFPLPHKSEIITMQNYLEEIARVLKISKSTWSQ